MIIEVLWRPLAYSLVHRPTSAAWGKTWCGMSNIFCFLVLNTWNVYIVLTYALGMNLGCMLFHPQACDRKPISLRAHDLSILTYFHSWHRAYMCVRNHRDYRSSNNKSFQENDLWVFPNRRHLTRKLRKAISFYLHVFICSMFLNPSYIYPPFLHAGTLLDF